MIRHKGKLIDIISNQGLFYLFVNFKNIIARQGKLVIYLKSK